MGYDRTGCFIALALYIFFAVVTFGFLFRNGRPGLPRRAVQALFAVVWPLYWIIIHGVAVTCVLAFNQLAIIIRAAEAIPSAIVFVFTPLVPFFQWVWAAGMFVFPAFYIATQWGTCSGWGCLGTIMVSLLWAPFWPLYAALALF